tara:strand:+ start:554 stop:844 length:291 start_codon:yes stop_codon:yes gene_type:complete
MGKQKHTSIPQAHADHLYKIIAELEKELDKHRGGFVACMTGKQFVSHNLGQQAKGINDLLLTLVKSNGEPLKVDNLTNLIVHARHMANKLGEQASA